jgi:hypothetical protein
MPTSLAVVCPVWQPWGVKDRQESDICRSARSLIDDVSVQGVRMLPLALPVAELQLAGPTREAAAIMQC